MSSRHGGTYRIHIGRTGYGGETRIIVMCGHKVDDIRCWTAAIGKRVARELRAQYGVKRATRWDHPDDMARGIWQ